MKKAITIIWLVLLIQLSYGKPIEPGDWSRVREYGHAYNVNDFTDDEYDWIEDHYNLFCIEKRHAKYVYGEISSEVASIATAATLIENNPSVQPLFYWNVKVVYETIYETIQAALVEHPEWVGDNGWSYDDPACKDWMIDILTEYGVNSGHSGVFLDQVQAFQGPDEYIFEIMSATPGIVIYNGYTPRGWESNPVIGATSDFMEHADGVYVEHFFHGSHIKYITQGKALLDSLLDVPNDKIIIAMCSPDTEYWDAPDHKFSLAAYLIIANDNSYYHYLPNGLLASDYMTYWDDDFEQYLGEPKGKATVNGYIYTRTFENCEVQVDVENKTSSIVWGDLTGPVDVEPCNGEIVMRSEVYGSGATPDTLVEMYLGDSVIIKPQISIDEVSSTGSAGTWSWIGPNSFTQSGRNITLEPVTLSDFGIYTVTYEEDECLFIDEIEISQLDVTAIKYDAELTSEIVIYPNPIQDVLNIKVPEAKITTYEIISINGITVEKGEILNGVESIDVTGLSKGIYFININSDEKVARKSFVKL